MSSNQNVWLKEKNPIPHGSLKNLSFSFDHCSSQPSGLIKLVRILSNFLGFACLLDIPGCMYSAQKKKLNGPEDAKYFSPVDGGTFFLAPLYYGRSSPVYPLVRRWYVEWLIFYLNYATPTPNLKSCKLWKKNIDLW